MKIPSTLKGIKNLTGVEISKYSSPELTQLFRRVTAEAQIKMTKQEKYAQQLGFTPPAAAKWKEEHGSFKVDMSIPRDINKLRKGIIDSIDLLRSETITRKGINDAISNYAKGFSTEDMEVSEADVRKFFREYEKDKEHNFFTALDDMKDEYTTLNTNEIAGTISTILLQNKKLTWKEKVEKIREELDKRYERSVKPFKG